MHEARYISHAEVIGPRVGAKVGPRVGVAVGIGTDELAAGGMAGVARDATSGIYCPATAAQWTQTLGVAGIASGNPSVLYLLQEASGNIADSIGTFTGTATGTGFTYSNVEAGWSRVGVGMTDAATGQWLNTSASLPDPATTSMLMLTYANVTNTPAAARLVTRMAGTTTIRAQITTTPRAQIIAGANTATGTTSDPHGAVRPWVLKHNVTASAQALYTDQEKVVPTFAALSGKQILLGGSAAVAAATTHYLYSAVFFAAAAELTDAQVKKLLQTLGWTPAWT